MTNPEGASVDDGDAQSRRAADLQIVERMRMAGPSSHEFQSFSMALASYGLGTLLKLHEDNMIFHRLDRLGARLPRPSADYYRQESRSLVNISVAAAIPRFAKDYIFGDKWDPERSSITTTFVNACLLSFAREYRVYISQERTWQAELVEADFPDPDRERLVDWRPGPESVVATRDEVARLLPPDADPQLREMFFLTAQGYSQAEIAEHLSVSPESVSSRVRRYRKSIRQHRLSTAAETENLHSDSPQSVPESVRAELLSWGIASATQARTVLQCIEVCRAYFEDSRRPALYRPVPGADANRLEFILDRIPYDTENVRSRKAWAENGARVCRHVINEMRKVEPGVERPGGSGKRDAQEALRRLYTALRIVAADDTHGRRPSGAASAGSTP